MVKKNRTCLTYTFTHKVAAGVKVQLVKVLQTAPYLLNIDEAANNSNAKFTNIMINYFGEEQGAVVYHHLASAEVNISTAENIS